MILIEILIVIVVAIAVYFLLRKGEKIKKSLLDGATMSVKLDIEKIDTVLKMQTAVSYFKTLDLVQERDVPFIAIYCDDVKEHITLENVDIPDKYTAYLLGVLNDKTNQLTSMKVIMAKEIDSEFSEAMGEESIIVLS